MTRPKVPDDKRQRTARACDICKRRKQKCNGKRPCITCVKRNLSCVYTTSTPASASANAGTDGRWSPAKRRLIQDVSSLSTARAPGAPPPRRNDSAVAPTFPANVKNEFGYPMARPHDPRRLLSQQRSGTSSVTDVDGRSCQNTTSEPDEEADVLVQMRMLQDPKRRLIYVGDSASLSYLQLIRMIVENSSGTSAFTTDPRRHQILEAADSLPVGTPVPRIVPDRETASVLIESYFTNTRGLIDVLDRRKFDQYFDNCYIVPPEAEDPQLCLLHLTLAIGLVMATPAANSREEAIVRQLRSGPLNQAELYFFAAKSLRDPHSGFEDEDLWSVQALILMTVYLLAASKRNAAHAHHGMAVQTSYALGLHRIKEVTLVFSADEVVLRRNIWRSLFVLDRFMSASLGRPVGIHEEDCSEGSVDAPSPMSRDANGASQDDVGAKALDATVKTCQSIGEILRRVYSKRRISTKIAQEIFDDYEKCPQIPGSELDPRQLFSKHTTPSHGLSILHVNLFHCHSTILLLRPFFLYLIVKTMKSRPQIVRGHRRPRNKLDKFAEACVGASVRSIMLVSAAHRAGYLPHRDPFSLYFLFAATLIILSNEFVGLYRNNLYLPLITNAIDVISYCAQYDEQAQRLIYIVNHFHLVVEKSSRSATVEQTRHVHLTSMDRYFAEALNMLNSDPSTPLDQKHMDGTYHETSRRNSEASPDSYLGSYTTAPMPSLDAVSGPRHFIPKSSSTVSSTSSHTGMMADQTTFKTEMDFGDQVGDHEFDFDSFWETEAGAASARHAQFTMSQPRTVNVLPSMGNAVNVPAYIGGYGGSNILRVGQEQPQQTVGTIIPLGGAVCSQADSKR